MAADWREGLLDAYAGKCVLITGDTGFKGSWLSWMLARAGAEVHGYALDAPTDPALFDIGGIDDRIDHVHGDIRDFDALRASFARVRPQVVFHLAAQPIVRDSYDMPRCTFETNVMGTVNVLECVRGCDSVESVLNVTTDKVYLNAETPDHAFAEDEPLDGFDPYSNSKSCSELVTHSYANSFSMPPLSTVRAGNVIGGGDFGPHRIVPDCVRAMVDDEPIPIRNPRSMRPFQHVLESLCAYLLIASRQIAQPQLAGCYNVGPDADDCVDAAGIAGMWCDAWGGSARWVDCHGAGDAKHEAAFLQLDNAKLKSTFGWRPRWDVACAVGKTVEWTRAWLSGADVGVVMNAQIDEFLGGE